jgi:DnaJ-class molecular chaperone
MKGVPVQERVCPLCEGKGFPSVAQPSRPGRRLFPAACPKCGGKGKVPRGALALVEAAAKRVAPASKSQS